MVNYCPHLTELDGDCVLTGKSCRDTREAADCAIGVTAFLSATVSPFHNSRARKAGHPKRT